MTGRPATHPSRWQRRRLRQDERRRRLALHCLGDGTEAELFCIPLILFACDIERKAHLAQKVYFKTIQLGQIDAGNAGPLTVASATIVQKFGRNHDRNEKQTPKVVYSQDDRVIELSQLFEIHHSYHDCARAAFAASVEEAHKRAPRHVVDLVKELAAGTLVADMPLCLPT